MTEHRTGPAQSPYHQRLPYGERLSAAPLTDSPFFGFEGDLSMQPLEPMRDHQLVQLAERVL